MPSSARLKKAVLTAPLLLFMTAFPLRGQENLHQDLFTTSDGVHLHYIEAGQGETLLFIPGWLMPGDIWAAQLRDLSKDHHVVALDPRSQGDSDMTAQGNDPLRRARDIRELIEHLDLDSVVLVGWALGAFDCLAYLREFGTDKLNALVLVDGPLGAASSPGPVTLSPFLKAYQKDPAGTSRRYVRALFKRAPSPDLIGLWAKVAARVPADIGLAALGNTQPGDSWQPSLTALRNVSLLYAVTPKYSSQADYLRQVDPQARVEIFQDSGHALFFDEADRFNSTLRDFLRQAALYPPGLPGPQHKQALPFPTAPSAPAPTTLPTKVPTPRPILTPTPTVPVLNEPTEPPAPTAVPVPTAVPTRTPTPVRAVFITTPVEAPSKKARPISEVSPNHPAAWGKRPGAAPVQEGFFTTSDHVRLHYLEAGRGLTLVFIPGWLLPGEIWRPQLEGLSKDFHVVALDPRSQGGSDITTQGDEPVRQATDIQELLDHLQLKSVVLIGWSHGGFQLLAYLGQFGTDRLYAAVLVDSALGAAASPPNSVNQVRFLQQFRKDPGPAARGFVWNLFKKPLPPGFLKELSQAVAHTPPDIAQALMNNAFPGDRYEPSLPTLCQVPLLYAITPKYTFQSQYLLQVDHLARVEMFEDTGHALFVDDADRFNDLLRDFLARSSRYPVGMPATPSRSTTHLANALEGDAHAKP